MSSIRNEGLGIRNFVLLLLGVLFAMMFACSAFGATELRIVNDNVTSLDIVSIDIVSGEAEYRLKTPPYKFTNTADALRFANNTADYLGIEELTEGEASFPDISITYEKNETFTDAISFGNYPALTAVTFNGAYNLSNARAQRHFIVNKTGLTLTFNNLSFVGNNGGGVQIDTGTTTNFNGVTFNTVTASADTDVSHRDGAVYVGASGGTVTFASVTFTSNSSANGGAVYIAGGTSTFSGTNRFAGNTAA
ncbi:MAG: hypothetical protein IJU31_07060, partial [Synergistaceae bacterium]|nr:hypothetical protein [Synergistaceae bacterium]